MCKADVVPLTFELKCLLHLKNSINLTVLRFGENLWVCICVCTYICMYVC